MTWYYQGKEFTSEDIGDYIGFVYLITNLVTGRKYIGKKLLKTNRRIRRKTGRKVRRQIKESDWKEYYGSNDELKEDVKKYGKENFKREILHLCKTKGECSWYELKEQVERNVLLSEDYYNVWVMARIHSGHLRKEK